MTGLIEALQITNSAFIDNTIFSESNIMTSNASHKKHDVYTGGK